MDGDRIATLVAGYLQEIVRQTGIDLNMGLVQTAYANGASTEYITEKLVSIFSKRTLGGSFDFVPADLEMSLLLVDF